jgi:c-di-GMP-binding flagellar brake protein YcgR
MNGDILRAQVTYWKESDPRDTYIFLAVVGGLIAIAIVYSLIKKVLGGESISIARPSQGFSHSAFKRRAYDIGFSEGETDFLEHYARKLGVTSPQAIFSSRAGLDSFIKNSFKYIERHADTEESAEQLKGQLFSIREAMQLRFTAGNPVRSSRQLKARTPLSLVSVKEAHYSSILAVNESKALYVEPALDAFGSPIRFPRGAKIKVFFYAGNHVGYTFQSRSKGLVNVDGRQFMALSHSDAIKQLPSRRHERREARLSCRFFLMHVHAARDRGKVVKTVQVEKAAVPGIIIDLSAGGLSMQTMSPAHVGDFVKLSFDVGVGDRAAYASVVRVSRLRSGSAMHLKFVKISRKTVNEILAYVYGYD